MMIIAMFRSHLIHKYRIRAIKETIKKSKAAIIDDDGYWGKYYTKLDSYGTYGKMFLAVRKWTYKQFYPDL